MSEWTAREAAELAQTCAAMSEEEKLAVNRAVSEMREATKEPQALELLPRMRRTNLNPIGRFYRPNRVFNGVSIFRQPVNGLTFLRLGIRLPLDEPDLPLVALFRDLLTGLGAGRFSDEEFALFREKYTSHLATELEVIDSPTEEGEFRVELHLSAHARDAEFDQLFELFQVVLDSPHFDNVALLEQLVSVRCRRATQTIQANARSFLQSLTAAGFKPSGAFHDLADGLPALSALHEIVTSKRFADLSGRLIRLFDAIKRKATIRACVHVGTTEQEEKIVPIIASFIAKYNEARDPVGPVHEQYARHMIERQKCAKVFVQTDTIANCCLDLRRSFLYSDPSSAMATLFATFATDAYVHTLVRVELGAYGGWAIHNSLKNMFELSSYRDSNVAGIFKAFDRTLEMAVNGEDMTEDAIEDAIVKVFSQLDSPVAPQARGKTEWIWEDRFEMLQARRTQIYEATKEQLVKVAELLRAQPSVQATLSSQTIAPAPDGFTVIPVLAAHS
jgi:Zn-dependent M16 (insulinase) family peptidase